MSIPGAEVTELIQRVRAGSDSALGSLLSSYREYLLRIATDRIQSGLRPKMTPSDVVQGSLLAATKHFANFHGDNEQQFRTWLVTILTSQLIDGLRRFTEAEKRRADREVTRSEDLLNPDAAVDSFSRPANLQDDAERLLEVIQMLPEQQRDIVHARYLEGLTFIEISDRLSLPVTTCRRLWLDAIDVIAQATGEMR